MANADRDWKLRAMLYSQTYVLCGVPLFFRPRQFIFTVNFKSTGKEESHETKTKFSNARDPRRGSELVCGPWVIHDAVCCHRDTQCVWTSVPRPADRVSRKQGHHR